MYLRRRAPASRHELEPPTELVGCETASPFLSEDAPSPRGDSPTQSNLRRPCGLHPSAEKRLAIHPKPVIHHFNAGVIATDPHESHGNGCCVGIVSVLHQLGYGNHLIADEFCAYQL